MTGDGILIAGGGLASQRAIETLRARGYEGRIQMVCGETELPYDRPPLSKGLLAGEVEDVGDRLSACRAGTPSMRRAGLRLPRVGLDADRRRVRAR